MWSVKDHRDSNNSDIKSIDIFIFYQTLPICWNTFYLRYSCSLGNVRQFIRMLFQKWSWFLVIDRYFFPHQNQIEDDQKSASKTSALYTSHVVNREKTMVQNHWQLHTNFQAILNQNYRFFYFSAWFKKAPHQNHYLLMESSTLGYILSWCLIFIAHVCRDWHFWYQIPNLLSQCCLRSGQWRQIKSTGLSIAKRKKK